MTKKITLIFLMALVAAVSCVREDDHMAQQEQVDVNVLSQKSINTAEDAVAGTLAVLLQENVADALAAGQSVPALNEACEQIGARLQRAFTYSGTPLERKHNVHRWYALSFPSDVDVRRLQPSLRDFLKYLLWNITSR